MINYYDRQGNPLELLDWAQRYEDSATRLVAVDFDEEKELMVSTIWQGFDVQGVIGDLDREPLIFETAILWRGDIQSTWQTPTEESALAMHNEVCVKFLEREARPEEGRLQAILDAERT